MLQWREKPSMVAADSQGKQKTMKPFKSQNFPVGKQGKNYSYAEKIGH